MMILTTIVVMIGVLLGGCIIGMSYQKCIEQDGFHNKKEAKLDKFVGYITEMYYYDGK